MVQALAKHPAPGIPAASGFETVACLLCGSDCPKIFYAHRNDPFLRTLGLGRQVAWNMCMACGFMYQSPRPTKSLLTEVYRNSYRPAEPSSDYLAVKRADAEDKCAWLTGQLGAVRNGARAMDVGSGEGSLVSSLKRAGWEAYGTEVTESFAEWGRRHLNVNIHAGEFDDSVHQGLRFDLITLSHVIEHIHDIWSFLAMVRERMEPGASVFVEVPDFLIPRGALSQNLFASPHLWGFSADTLVECMRQAGFKIVTVERLVSVRGNVIRLLARAEGVDAHAVARAAPSTDAVARAYLTMRQRIVWHRIGFFLKTGWKDAVKTLLGMPSGVRPSRGRNGAVASGKLSAL